MVLVITGRYDQPEARLSSLAPRPPADLAVLLLTCASRDVVPEAGQFRATRPAGFRAGSGIIEDQSPGLVFRMRFT